MIDAKIAGEKIVARTVEAPPRVVNLMDAMKKSQDAVRTTKKKHEVSVPGDRAGEASWQTGSYNVLSIAG
jgi:non-homologous end joining protein Ku